MPARRSTLFATSPTARPTPCGAGLSVTTTDPRRAVTRKGNEWERWQPHSQDPQPRLISIMFNFALSMARRIDGPTSRPRAQPRPANPSLFPTMHVMTKFTRRPESVIRWTMFTSRTSSSVSGNRTSTISGSRMGRLVLIASPRLVISPARTMRPSFVFGTQAERSRSGRAARASLRRPPLRCGIREPPRRPTVPSFAAKSFGPPPEASRSGGASIVRGNRSGPPADDGRAPDSEDPVSFRHPFSQDARGPQLLVQVGLRFEHAALRLGVEPAIRPHVDPALRLQLAELPSHGPDEAGPPRPPGRARVEPALSR